MLKVPVPSGRAAARAREGTPVARTINVHRTTFRMTSAVRTAEKGQTTHHIARRRVGGCNEARIVERATFRSRRSRSPLQPQRDNRSESQLVTRFGRRLPVSTTAK